MTGPIVWAETLRPVAAIVATLLEVEGDESERARAVSRCLFGVMILAAHGSVEDLRRIAEGFGEVSS